MHTIDIDKTDGVISVSVDGNPARTLYNPNNLTVKPLENGAILKLTDETWRQHFSMDDTVSQGGGDPVSPFDDVPALVTFINSVIDAA